MNNDGIYIHLGIPQPHYGLLFRARVFSESKKGVKKLLSLLQNSISSEVTRNLT